MNSHPKITGYEQEIRREHESPRSKLSHSQSSHARIWTENLTAERLGRAADWGIMIWLARRQDNVLKQGSLYSPEFKQQL